MAFKTRQEAQKIILRRCGAIVVDDNNRSLMAESFTEKATAFASLKKNGLNYLQIEKELRK